MVSYKKKKSIPTGLKGQVHVSIITQKELTSNKSLKLYFQNTRIYKGSYKQLIIRCK